METSINFLELDEEMRQVVLDGLVDQAEAGEWNGQDQIAVSTDTLRSVFDRMQPALLGAREVYESSQKPDQAFSVISHCDRWIDPALELADRAQPFAAAIVAAEVNPADEQDKKLLAQIKSAELDIPVLRDYELHRSRQELYRRIGWEPRNYSYGLSELGAKYRELPEVDLGQITELSRLDCLNQANYIQGVSETEISPKLIKVLSRIAEPEASWRFLGIKYSSLKKAARQRVSELRGFVGLAGELHNSLGEFARRSQLVAQIPADNMDAGGDTLFDPYTETTLEMWLADTAEFKQQLETGVDFELLRDYLQQEDNGQPPKLGFTAV